MMSGSVILIKTAGKKPVLHRLKAEKHTTENETSTFHIRNTTDVRVDICTRANNTDKGTSYPARTGAIKLTGD